jgi:ABC-type spermidine/putrescine transport system permease subunit II
VAGAILAFALSFDEIIVTTFTAGYHSRHCRSGLLEPHQPPGTARCSNVVALIVMAITVVDHRGRNACFASRARRADRAPGRWTNLAVPSGV